MKKVSRDNFGTASNMRNITHRNRRTVYRPCVLRKNKFVARTGKKSRITAYYNILKNRTYIGEYNHSGVFRENGVPAIVTKEMFDADSEKAGVIQDIDFIFSTDGSHTGMVKTTDEGYTASQVPFKIANTSTGQQFYFMRSSTGVVFYAIEGTGLTLTVIGVQSNAASNDESKWTSA